jgi:magnesium transporter
MKRPSLIGPEIEEILNSSNKAEQLKENFKDIHPYDIFILCEDLESHQIADIVKSLGIPTGIDVFEQFDAERKREIFGQFDREWMADILEEMAPDKRADFVKSLPEEKVEQVLPLVARAERIDIKKLIEYEEGTAGSLMTTEYASLAPNITVDEAIEKIKAQAFDRETIYYIYVIDSERRLIGIVSLRDILLAPRSKKIEDIMNKNVISDNVSEDSEIVAKRLSDYDFLAIPIVDQANRLVGIVTHDDVVDVVIEESTEDMYRYGAVGGYIDYLKSTPFQMAKQRALWLMILVFVGFITSWVLQKNSSQVQAVVALSFFIPLLLGAGGNAGTQSSTVVIRGLSTGGIKIDDFLKVFKKELYVGIIVGSFMAILVSLRCFITKQDPRLGITVGSAMVATVMLATTLGSFLPILFKRLNLDPALMSGPFITSIVDVVSLLIYFKIASLIF